MGPRSFDRGNVTQFLEVHFYSSPLQWGRGLLTAEIWNSPRALDQRNRFNGAAVF